MAGTGGEGNRPGLREVPAEFSRHDAGWLKLSYHPSLEARLRVLRREAEGVRQELREALGPNVLTEVDVRVLRTPEEMARFFPPGSRPPKYAAGLAFPGYHLVLMTEEPVHAGSRHELLEVFHHELAHIALADALGAGSVPRWFNEGFAIHESGEALGDRLQTLGMASLGRRLMPLAELSRTFPEDETGASIAYAQAADIVRYLRKDGQEARFRDVLTRVAQGQEFKAALADAYSADLMTIESEWLEDVARRYSFWPILLGGSTLWIFGLGLLVAGYVRRRKRASRKLAEWAEQEAAQDAVAEQRRRLLEIASQGHAQLRLGPNGILVDVARVGDAVVIRPAKTANGEPRSGAWEARDPAPVADRDGAFEGDDDEESLDSVGPRADGEEGRTLQKAPSVPHIRYEGRYYVLH